jgi:PKHD-type hydroxylase
MKGEWCYFKSYFNKEQCERIINDSLALEPMLATTFVGENQEVTPDIRRSTVRFIQNDDSRFSDLFDILWRTQLIANREFFNVHVTKLDFIQFAEYHERDQGEYRTHQDTVWINEGQFHRKLSCTICLSDPEDYVGGDFEFVDVGTYPLASDLRLQGTVLYFPSFLKHRVTPVIRGARYSITAWFEGPKWR